MLFLKRIGERPEPAPPPEWKDAGCWMASRNTGVFLLDIRGYLLLVNPGLARLTGYAENELRGRHFRRLLSPGAAWTLFRLIHRVWTRKEARLLTARLRRSDSEWRDIELLIQPVGEKNQEIAGFIGHIWDVSARPEPCFFSGKFSLCSPGGLPEEIPAAEKSGENALIRICPAAIAVLNHDFRVERINRAFERLFGYGIRDAEGRLLGDLIIPESLRDQAPETGWRMPDGEKGEVYSLRRRQDGRHINVGINIAPVMPEGRSAGIYVVYRDRTPDRERENEIRFRTSNDTVTGLLNREAFYRQLKWRIREPLTTGTTGWTLLHMDIERFRVINEAIGYKEGDEVLALLGRRLMVALRQSDLVSRIGSDEFLLLIGGVVDKTDLLHLTKKIRNVVSQVIQLDERQFVLQPRFGAARFPADGRSAPRLLKCAEMALYSAKEKGEEIHFFTEDIHARILERIDLEQSLRKALRRDEFVLHYQPLVNDRYDVVGMEALVRWQHPEKGLLDPGSFIPMAEETGLIVPLGKQILRLACRQGRELQKSMGRNLFISVNLSARQFRDPCLADQVLAAISDAGLQPETLKLEITESAIMEDPDDAVEKMRRLTAAGTQFSVDDFGTGYSSLSQLRRFPIDTLKIDKSFITNKTGKKNGVTEQEIVKAIISMARDLGICVIAEGVETKTQKKFLDHHGCRIMQGFYFSHPLPYEQIQTIFTRVSRLRLDHPSGAGQTPPAGAA
ncbi:MAG: hypothetical protein CSB33_03025 [Desulfobacterales bacterium]|nr:MAG: hypothetical protein CSB33_03025 [Desulfobacterales bacterium]